MLLAHSSRSSAENRYSTPVHAPVLALARAHALATAAAAAPVHPYPHTLPYPPQPTHVLALELALAPAPEKESLLAPGTQLKVISRKQVGKIAEIHCEEIGRLLS